MKTIEKIKNGVVFAALLFLGLVVLVFSVFGGSIEKDESIKLSGHTMQWLDGSYHTHYHTFFKAVVTKNEGEKLTCQPVGRSSWDKFFLRPIHLYLDGNLAFPEPSVVGDTIGVSGSGHVPYGQEPTSEIWGFHPHLAKW